MKRFAWMLITLFGLMSLAPLGAAAQERVYYGQRPVVVYRPVVAERAYFRQRERRAWRRHERREWRREQWRRHERWERRNGWR